MDEGARSAVRTETEVVLYDFGRSTTLSREQARILEMSFEAFARQWGSLLSAQTHGRSQVDVESVSMQTYDEYARSLPPATTLVVCALPGSDARAVIQFPASLATAWVVQMVGGRASEDAPERPLTHIEQALVRSLIADAIEHLVRSFDGVLPDGITISGIQHSSQFSQVAAANDPVIVAVLPIGVSGGTANASVMLPASVVLRSLAGGAGNAPETAPAGMIDRQVERTPVELSLRLAPRSIRPHEVLDLSVGDLITFPHTADRPLDLMVGDLPVATAAVGTSGARLACVVTATTPEPAQELP
ncbi:FliM/FliN family flagellar motor switch protein [Microbacterium sp. ARD32]|uniref:flagellar motor switch protein FliM n=1 Tax=Microbacterium sp. ARD32 TaxID=2962577 RepID=UPI002881929C|nr:FliM/FliN family flagellar motor switch protein [Microbacterium sp. ARD32]MDT0156361.1 FliM/FliN family flagellar motor switch protein [Microbacterium sp. ARD32]